MKECFKPFDGPILNVVTAGMNDIVDRGINTLRADGFDSIRYNRAHTAEYWKWLIVLKLLKKLAPTATVDGILPKNHSVVSECVASSAILRGTSTMSHLKNVIVGSGRLLACHLNQTRHVYKRMKFSKLSHTTVS